MKLKEVNYIVIHCSATKPNQDIGAAEIDKMHKARGFSSIGYHYVITLNGVIEKGRPEETVGAHVKGYNSQSIGVCYVGGLDENGKAKDTRNEDQFKALSALVKDLSKRYPNAKVLGHRDLSPDTNGNGVIERHEWLKECPCFDVSKHLHVRQ